MGIVEGLQAELGHRGVVTDPEVMAPYLTDWKGTTTGPALCLVRPASTTEVSRAVKLCAAANVEIVPQGGNSGLSAGAVPIEGSSQVVMTFERLNTVRALDPIGLTIEVEAGCILQAVREQALAADCLLPISFAAEGTATIGGIVATNAGGINVLRYGMTRSQVLGLEVVLPDGEILSGLRCLRKNNAGYDWKQLFIGSEGTLGIVTAAVLKLVPTPRETVTALMAVESPAAALQVFALAQRAVGDQISAFELISDTSIELLKSNLALVPPIDSAAGWLIVMDGASSLSGLRDAIETMLAKAMEHGLILDAVIAGSDSQARALWKLRESVTEAEAMVGGSVKHDVSVPISVVPEFLAATDRLIAAEFPGMRVNAFGHLGDGNIHYNVLAAGRADPLTINAIVHDRVTAMGGSISAEHGIGQYRLDEFARCAAPAELAFARRLKTAIDPANLLNPGKVIATVD